MLRKAGTEGLEEQSSEPLPYAGDRLSMSV